MAISASTLTVGGVISGAHSLTKTGAGTLTLNGSDTYSGGTTLTAGTLNINNATAIGSGAFAIGGGTIDNTSGSAITLSNNNTQSWNGDFTFTGTNDLNLGSGAVSLAADRTVITSAGALTVGGVISGAHSLVKSGAGTLILGGANTYSGGTTVSAGTLQGTTTSLQGSIADNAALVFDQTSNGTYTSVISGLGTVSKSGTGVVTLSGTNTFSGATNINAGTLALTGAQFRR